METAVLVPQQFASLTLAAAAAAEAAPARKAAGVTSIPKAGAAARRKTLCDITNLRCPSPAEEKHGPMRAADPCAAADGVSQLVKENSDLMRLLEERDKIIELNGTELQKLRLANWHLAQANSQMLAELNHGRNRLKALQHELACSRATTKAKSLELEEVNKAMKRSRNLTEKAAVETVQQQHGCDRASQIKDGGVVNPEPAAADASSHAASAKKLANGSRKRVLRSRSLGPAASAKMAAAPKETESVQRR
ncbi:hypothetical protein GUJ93_ZPchr0012g19283 [Zizania palustris]|nr:hypothetical protein GUJ93_ZPchr0012g19283 [Zizania palustris]